MEQPDSGRPEAEAGGAACMELNAADPPAAAAASSGGSDAEEDWDQEFGCLLDEALGLGPAADGEADGAACAPPGAACTAPMQHAAPWQQRWAGARGDEGEDFQLTPSPASSTGALSPSDLRRQLLGGGDIEGAFSPAHSPAGSQGEACSLEGCESDGMAAAPLEQGSGEEGCCWVVGQQPGTAACVSSHMGGMHESQVAPGGLAAQLAAAAAVGSEAASTEAAAAAKAAAAAQEEQRARKRQRGHRGNGSSKRQRRGTGGSGGTAAGGIAAAPAAREAPRSPLECLPCPVLLRVLSFLSAEDLTASATVVSVLARMAKEPVLWRRLFNARWARGGAGGSAGVGGASGGSGRAQAAPRCWKVCGVWGRCCSAAYLVCCLHAHAWTCSRPHVSVLCPANSTLMGGLLEHGPPVASRPPLFNLSSACYLPTF